MTKALAAVVAVVAVIAVAVCFLYVKPAPHQAAFGAVANLGNSPVLTVNGLNEYFYSAGLQTGTSGIVCSFLTPNATTTLGNAAVTFTVGTTTATTVYLAKATTAAASTTLIGTLGTLAASTQGTFVASTTVTQDGSAVKVFAPNSYFNVGLTGGTGTYSPTGLCTATFRQVSPGA